MGKNKQLSNKRKRKMKRIALRVLSQVILTLLIVGMIAPFIKGNENQKNEDDSNVTTKQETTPTTEATDTTTIETTDMVEESTEDTREPVDTKPIEIPIKEESPPQVIQKPQVKPVDSRKGLIGRLLIPSVGIDLAVREPVNDSEAQAFVDERDSAAIFWRGDARIIADHNNQGFAYLSKVSIGDKAEMCLKDGSQISYTVVDKFKGHNTGPELTDEDYNCIYDDNIGGLTLYTCYAGWENIWVVYLQPA